MRVPRHECFGCHCWRCSASCYAVKSCVEEATLHPECCLLPRSQCHCTVVDTSMWTRPTNACYICYVEMFWDNWATWRAVITGFSYCSIKGTTHNCELRWLGHVTSMQSITIMSWLRRGRSQSSTSWAYLRSSEFRNTNNALNSQVYKLGGCKGGVIV